MLGVLHGGSQIALTCQHVVNGVLQGELVDAASHGGVALGIEVDQQDAPLGGDQRGCEVDTGGGLADPAFLIGDCEYLGHGHLPPHSVRRSISRWR